MIPRGDHRQPAGLGDDDGVRGDDADRQGDDGEAAEQQSPVETAVRVIRRQTRLQGSEESEP